MLSQLLLLHYTTPQGSFCWLSSNIGVCTDPGNEGNNIQAYTGRVKIIKWYANACDAISMEQEQINKRCCDVVITVLHYVLAHM